MDQRMTNNICMSVCVLNRRISLPNSFQQRTLGNVEARLPARKARQLFTGSVSHPQTAHL